MSEFVLATILDLLLGILESQNMTQLLDGAQTFTVPQPSRRSIIVEDDLIEPGVEKTRNASSGCC